jgi:hypothetical protein
MADDLVWQDQGEYLEDQRQVEEAVFVARAKWLAQARRGDQNRTTVVALVGFRGHSLAFLPGKEFSPFWAKMV